MANSLTGLQQTIYSALNVVSRELIGMIMAVSKDPSAEQVTLNQPIRSPVVPKMNASDISPSNVASTGSDRNVGYVDLQITKQRKVSFHITGEEEKGLMAGGNNPSITQQSFTQAFRTLANEIEKDLCDEYIHASRAFGTAGTTPFGSKDDLSDLSFIRKVLDDNGAPRSNRSLVLNSSAIANLRGKQPSVFRVNEDGTPAGRRQGSVGMLFDMDIGESGLFEKHDASGTISGVAINRGAGVAAGTTDLPVDGGGAGEILNAGDLITVANDSEKYVAQAMAASANTLRINAPGLQQAAADNRSITAVGDYLPSLVLTRDAVHLACRVPAVPEGGDGAEDRMYIVDPISMLAFEVAVYRQYRQVTYEVGLCWGVKTIKAEHMAILIG